MAATSVTEKTVQEQSYDEVPYGNRSFVHTHPQNLYTVAKLLGLNPPDFRKCRVLELGCALGGNLFPQAQQYPESEFVGIDISGKQIDQAEEAAQSMGLGNVSFMQEDISKLTRELGQFDYIIAHGVLSWVPPDVGEKIFQICRENISENGIGFISFNTLPGWNMSRSIRDAMLFHAKYFETPEEKISQSKSFLKLLSEGFSEKDPYKAVIDAEIREIARQSDNYLIHEYLEDENHQFYFHQFAAMADQYDLQYVGDARLPTMFIGDLPKPTVEKLMTVANDVVLQEQYVDFLRNRRFRNSIITNKKHEVVRSWRPEVIFDFLVNCNIVRDDEKSTKEHAVFRLKNEDAGVVAVDDPQVAELFVKLSQAGERPVRLGDFIEDHCASKQEATRIHGIIAKSGMGLVMKGFLSIYSDEGTFVDKVSEKPIASPWARYQAAQEGCFRVTNCLGASMQINMLTRFLLVHSDGTNNMSRLAEKLMKYAQDQNVNVKLNGVEAKNEKETATAIAGIAHETLQKFAKTAFLIG